MRNFIVGLISTTAVTMALIWPFIERLSYVARQDVIEHRVVDHEHLGSLKLSLTVEVQLIDERLPNEAELGALSKLLVRRYPNHDKTFVTFYLPEMEHGAGAFATAHHTPEMVVKVLSNMLAQYPHYAKFAE